MRTTWRIIAIVLMLTSTAGCDLFLREHVLLPNDMAVIGAPVTAKVWIVNEDRQFEGPYTTTINPGWTVRQYDWDSRGIDFPPAEE